MVARNKGPSSAIALSTGRGQLSTFTEGGFVIESANVEPSNVSISGDGGSASGDSSLALNSGELPETFCSLGGRPTVNSEPGNGEGGQVRGESTGISVCQSLYIRISPILTLNPKRKLS